VRQATGKNGDIVLVKLMYIKTLKNHIHLTDGQQRLTTIYLGICLLEKAFQKKGRIKKIV
jgi:uncharacterized protein with ParB-like and HNH nuclease domain